MTLPRTSENRRDRGFLRLLTFVDPAAPAGLQFDGQLLTPGAEFDPALLPCPAVLLECAGKVRVAATQSRYSFEHIWLLWRYDFDAGKWIEIVRTTSRDSSWTMDFAAIAHRHLHADAFAPPVERAAPIAAAIQGAIEQQLAKVARDAKAQVLAMLDAYIAAEIVRYAAPLSLVRKGPGFARIGGGFAHSARPARLR